MNLITAQISGTIKDQNGHNLSFATIYIEGTTKGTVSNTEGRYEIFPEKTGTYHLVFQYLGYQSEKIAFQYKGIPIAQNVVLIEDLNIQNELVISADREDPAYEIIRKAIQKRKYYKNLVKSSESDLYVKGTIKILSAPESVFGNKIGTMDGILDTMGQGIVYLSESKSKYYFQSPDKSKEVMLFSKTAGNENLFTANQFSLASFDFYDNYLRFGRSIVSPIAENALEYYNYKLEQTAVDKNGLMINKIKITPKSANKPLVLGYIYITDELWNIQSLDILLSGSSLNSTFLDTIRIKQIFLPVEKPDIWRLFTQVVEVDAGVFGFKMGGHFTYIFSDYRINEDLNHMFVNKETFRVEQNASEQDSLYWNQTRPIPLTDEEVKDYQKKDSLKIIWNSKTFLDSMDKADNKPKLSNIFFGYAWNKSYKKIRYFYDSPLSTIRFNAVEGLKLNLDGGFQWSDSLLRRLVINPVIEYGFSDKKWKPRIAINYRFNNLMLGSIGFKTGRRYVQFDNRSPITERNNSWATLLYKTNRMRIYQQDIIGVSYQRELVNSFYINTEVEYVNRSPLEVTTHYSFFDREKLFAPNIPREDIDPAHYSPNKYLMAKIHMRWRPGQTYSSYPNLRTRRSSKWPELHAIFEQGIATDNISPDFSKIKLVVKDNYVNAKLYGYFRYNVEFGSFMGTTPGFFADYFHPLGNELLMPIDPDLHSFNLMPYYSFSTNKYYTLVNFRHHFNGYLLDKIPLIRKTKLKSVAGISYLTQPDKGSYTELTIGIENFRIGPFPLFSLDYSWAFDKNGYRDRGLVIRLSALLNN